jgi:hypothetical protein
MRALFPALIGWLLFCFFLGILSQAARKAAQYFLGPESLPRVRSHPKKETHVVILGGGFAGVTTALHLEKRFRERWNCLTFCLRHHDRRVFWFAFSASHGVCFTVWCGGLPGG